MWLWICANSAKHAFAAELQVQSKKYERNSRAISYVYTQPIVKLLKNFLLVSGLDMSVTPSLVDLGDVTLATN